MRIYDPGELIPHLTSFVTWKHKKQFLYSEYVAQEWVMFIVEDGLIEYDIDGRKGTAAKQDILLCPPDIPFRRKMLSPATFYFFAFTWTDREGVIINRAQQLHPNPAGKYRIQDRYRLSSTCNFLSKISDRTDEVSRSRRNALTWDIWQLYSWEQELLNQKNRRQKNDSLMRHAESIMQSKGCSSLSVQQLAHDIGLSTAQLTRRFKAYFGITPGDYLITLRLNKARNLLAETDYTLEYIAKQCGYENGYYLSRVFSNKMKMSPTEYRRTHQL